MKRGGLITDELAVHGNLRGSVRSFADGRLMLARDKAQELAVEARLCGCTELADDLEELVNLLGERIARARHVVGEAERLAGELRREAARGR